ncbi:chaplin [Streptomyces sp. NPDC048606]|uniref:chaplin n=1 Tax=Streptomyces sp. NPDC048606 TaxID=3154726 RepID=UPI00341A5362
MIKNGRGRSAVTAALRHYLPVATAALLAAVVPLTVLGPANASSVPAGASSGTHTVANQSSRADVAGTATQLRNMGLTVGTPSGSIVAWGDAGIVNDALTLFADQDPMAIFTGLNETGTGYMLIRGTNIARWVGLTAGANVPIASVRNESDGNVVVYDQMTGRLNVAEDKHTAENLPIPHAAGTTRRAGATHGAVAYATEPGLLSGGQIQIPVQVPVNICSSSVGIVSVINPAFGNACVQA